MLEAIFFGILQGITEFIPISSTAHLRIAGEFMGKAHDPGARFTAITQIGTELAVLIYFRKDIGLIFSSWSQQTFKRAILEGESKTQARIGWLVIIGSIPIMIFGYFGRNYITNQLRSLWLIAVVMILFSVILWATDKFGRTHLSLNDLTSRHGLFYGLAQALALIPGVSRSGATIAMGRYLGYSRDSALRYSFLLAIPAVFGSGVYQLRGALISDDGTNAFTLTETFAATLTAFTVGYLVIAWLLRFISTKSFTPFIIYRILLGILLLTLLTTGVINP